MSGSSKFDFPIFPYSRRFTPDRCSLSPPPERIIKNANLHPRTMGQMDSTRKLCYAPFIKTLMCKHSSKRSVSNLVAEDPIFFRFLNLLSEFDGRVINAEKDLDLKIIVIGMISSINRLNGMFVVGPKLVGENICFELDGAVLENVETLNYYNSFRTLVSFNKNVEIFKSNKSIVYRVKNDFDRKIYVLKTGVNNKVTEEIKHLNRSNLELLNEIKILAPIDHPNIIRYFTSWFEQRSFVEQLEYIVGESLHYFLYETNKVPTNELKKMLPLTNKASELAAVEIVKQIGVALHYLHEVLGVVHNDMKPAHIMIVHDRYSSLFIEDDIESLRSMIYQCLLRTRVPQGVTFKLCGFKRSFHFCESKVVSDHSSDYLPLRKSGLLTFDEWKRRDVYGLGMTVLHVINGALNFLKHKALDNVHSEHLKLLLETIVDLSKSVSTRDLQSAAL